MSDDTPEKRLDRLLRRQRLNSPSLWGIVAFFALLAGIFLFFLAGPKPETRFFHGEVLATTAVPNGTHASAPALAIGVGDEQLSIRLIDPLPWKAPGETICVGETSGRFFGIVYHKIWPDWHCR